MGTSGSKLRKQVELLGRWFGLTDGWFKMSVLRLGNFMVASSSPNHPPGGLSDNGSTNIPIRLVVVIMCQCVKVLKGESRGKGRKGRRWFGPIICPSL